MASIKAYSHLGERLILYGIKCHMVGNWYFDSMSKDKILGTIIYIYSYTSITPYSFGSILMIFSQQGSNIAPSLNKLLYKNHQALMQLSQVLMAITLLMQLRRFIYKYPKILSLQSSLQVKVRYNIKRNKESKQSRQQQIYRKQQNDIF